MIFEATNREEIIIRMDLYEANAFAETGFWQLNTAQGVLDRTELRRAISETESASRNQLPACDTRDEDPRDLIGGQTDNDLTDKEVAAIRATLRWKELP